MTAAHATDGFKRSKGVGRRSLLLVLGLSLQVGNGWFVERDNRGKAARLEGATVVSWAVVVEALADDFAAAHDDAAVAKMHGREGGLLEAKIEVAIRLHVGAVL